MNSLHGAMNSPSIYYIMSPQHNLSTFLPEYLLVFSIENRFNIFAAPNLGRSGVPLPTILQVRSFLPRTERRISIPYVQQVGLVSPLSAHTSFQLKLRVVVQVEDSFRIS